MKKKTLLLGILMIVALAILAGCTAPAPSPTATPVPTATATAEVTATPEAAAELELTLEELAAFDGKDGRPAYVAVDGIIYDMTNSAFWKNGAHNGFTAGRDLTKEIKERSPHGVANLQRVPAIGKIKE